MAKVSGTLPELDRTALPGSDDVLRRPLPHGAVVLARESFTSPSVVISGYLSAGSLMDTPETAGLADLTAQALTRGSRRRSFQGIYETLESIGASLSFGAGKHSTTFYCKGLAEDLGTLLDLLADVLRRPTFPKLQVDRLRTERLTSLAIRDQNTSARAQMTFHELAYPAHPYSLSGDGYKETVAKLTAEDLRAFHHSHYGPSGMTVVVVGAVSAERAADAVEARLADWRNPQQTSEPVLPELLASQEQRRKNVLLAGKTQCDLVLGAPGPSRFDPQFMAAALGNNILGQFGLMGRIGDRLREAEGLAYYAYSSLGGGPGPGAWQVIAGVEPSKLERAIELAIQELRRFVEQRVTGRELLDSQANFIGRLPLTLESNEGVAGALVRVERYRLGLDYYRHYPDLVAAVTRGEVMQAAQRFLDPAHLTIAVAGPELGGG